MRLPGYACTKRTKPCSGFSGCSSPGRISFIGKFSQRPSESPPSTGYRQSTLLILYLPNLRVHRLRHRVCHQWVFRYIIFLFCHQTRTTQNHIAKCVIFFLFEAVSLFFDFLCFLLKVFVHRTNTNQNSPHIESNFE